MDQHIHNFKKKEGFTGQRACILPQGQVRFSSKDKFCRLLYITDIGFYPNAAFHNRERPEGCKEYILIYCQKGSGWFRMKGKLYKVHANQFFILPSNLPHHYAADVSDPWSIYWVHFSGDLAAHYFNFLTKSHKPGAISSMVNPYREYIFEDIMEHLQFSNDNENILYSSSCLYGYLTTFHQSQRRMSINDNDIIQRVVQYMKLNLDKNLLLKEISLEVGVSPSHLSALFKKKMKYTPMYLFTSMKIQKACLLLMNTKDSIKQVSYSLGYDDPYHFSRVFKNVMGVSPKNFKLSGKAPVPFQI